MSFAPAVVRHRLGAGRPSVALQEGSPFHVLMIAAAWYTSCLTDALGCASDGTEGDLDQVSARVLQVEV